MARHVAPEDEDQVVEQKSSQRKLLILLGLLVILFLYLYFFTSLIRPRPANPPAPAPTAEAPVEKKPMPARLAQEGQPGTEEKKPAGKEGQTAGAPAKPAPGEKAAAPEAPGGKPGAPEAKGAKPVAPEAKGGKPGAAEVKGSKPGAPEGKAPAKAAAPEAKPGKPGAEAKAGKPTGAEAKAGKPGAAEGKAGKPSAAEQAKAAKAATPAEKAKAAAAETKGGKAEKEAAAEKAKAAHAAKAKAAAKPVGAYALELNGELAEGEIGSVTNKLKRAGIAHVVKIKSHKNEQVHRLYLADFGNRDEAAEELERLKLAAPEAFMLRENGRYAVYGGSYLREAKAVQEQERLYQKGVKLEVRTATAPIPVVKLRAGSFADKGTATKALESLKKAGIAATVVKTAK